MTRWSAAPTGWSACRRPRRSTPWLTGSSRSSCSSSASTASGSCSSSTRSRSPPRRVLFAPRHLRLRRRLRPVVRRDLHPARGRGDDRAVLAVVHRRRPDRPVQPGVLRRVPRRLVALHPGRHPAPQGHGRGVPRPDRDGRAVRLRPGHRLDHRRQGAHLPRRRRAELRRRPARRLARVVLPAAVPHRPDRRHVDRHDVALRHRPGLLQRLPAVQPGAGHAVHRRAVGGVHLRRPLRARTWCRASRPSRC